MMRGLQIITYEDVFKLGKAHIKCNMIILSCFLLFQCKFMTTSRQFKPHFSLGITSLANDKP